MKSPTLLPSMKTVAQAAKVTKMTVSLALRNHPSIPIATCQRIQKIADKLGYKKNPVVSMLTTELKKSRRRSYQSTLAYLTNYPKERWREDSIGKIFDGVTEQAHRLGYKIDVFFYKQLGMTGRRTSEIIHSRGIKGVLLSPNYYPYGYSHIWLNWSKFAVVTVGNRIIKPLIHCVINHFYHSMSLVLRELKKLGYRRIGLALRYEDNQHSDYLYLSRFLLYNSTIRPSLQIPPFTETYGKEENKWRKDLQKWYSQYKPEVIIHVSRYMPKWIAQMSLDVPNDVSLVNLVVTKDVPVLQNMAGIDDDPFLTGKIAVDLLAEQLYHNELGIPATPKVVLTYGKWVTGQTVRRQRRI